MNKKMEAAYRLAKQRYADLGVNTDAALKTIGKIPLSLHCWQGDDVTGFEQTKGGAAGGIQATGNFPGKARNIGELRSDIEFARTFLPGKLKLNLHACYLDAKKRVERNELAPEHFKSWVAWAKENRFGLDFNGTFFNHPLADLTLTSPDPKIRAFWIEHAIACRKIGAYFGRELKERACINLWIPDGSKEVPADTTAPRKRLKDSLDKIFKTKISSKLVFEALECKLFGIGSESYVAGSHEFYLGYAMKSGLGVCLDTGHFHPTESVADKISSVLLFVDEILLHLSRGVRWDSDHVLALSDETLAIGREVAQHYQKMHVGLDFFDASINRIAAWVVGARNAQKAILAGLLTPFAKLRKMEEKGRLGDRLALFEELKLLPLGAVWDYYCAKSGVLPGLEWLPAVEKYEAKTIAKRKA